MAQWGFCAIESLSAIRVIFQQALFYPPHIGTLSKLCWIYLLQVNNNNKTVIFYTPTHTPCVEIAFSKDIFKLYNSYNIDLLFYLVYSLLDLSPSCTHARLPRVRSSHFVGWQSAILSSSILLQCFIFV